jgi:inosine-uridine nucleoside N-ribohydrolase
MKKCLQKVTAPDFQNHTSVQTEVQLKFKLKHKIKGRSFIENLQFCVLLYSKSERDRYVVIWCSECSCVWCTRTECTKTVKVSVKVTVKVSHAIGTALRVTKRIFVFISQQYILHCNSVHIVQ